MKRDEYLRVLLRICVAVVCLGAAVLIVKILTGDRFGDETTGEALATAVAFAFISLSIGAGANLVVRQPRIALLGYLTIAVGGIALLLAANLIWRGSLFSTTTADHWSWYTLIGTFALGIVSMLLAGYDEDDTESAKLIRLFAVLALFALFVSVIAEVAERAARG